MASDERRLHPLSWVFTAAQFIKGFIVPALVVLFASGGASLELWSGVFIGPVVMAAMVKYVVYRYRLAEDEIVVRDGILTRTERHIPYERIQNIDLVRNPLHRMFKVALVRVQTASGTRPEAVMRVLSLDAVEEMRTRVFASRTTRSPAHDTSAGDDTAEATTPGQEPAATGAARAATTDHRERVLLRLPAIELVKLGIVSNKGLIVLGAALGLFSQSVRWETDWDDLIEPYLRSAADRLPLGPAVDWLTASRFESRLLTVGLLAMIGLVLAIILLRVFSIGWFFLQLHGFTLTRRGADLGADYGLLTRISRTIPTSRIQSLKSTETPLHRRFRRQSVELRTVGGGAAASTDVDFDPGGGGPKAESQWLAPMIDTERVPALLKQVLPDTALDGIAWEPIARRARRRIVRRWLMIIAPATLLAGLVVDPWALAPGVAAALFAGLHAHLYVRHAAYALTGWGLLFRTGWWNRTLTIVRYGKIQTVAFGESPFDRRHGMASVRIDTAGAESNGHTIAIPYLEAAVARDVARRLYAEAGRRAFRWA